MIEQRDVAIAEAPPFRREPAVERRRTARCRALLRNSPSNSSDNRAHPSSQRQFLDACVGVPAQHFERIDETIAEIDTATASPGVSTRRRSG